MAKTLKWVESLREVLTENELRWLAGSQALQDGKELAAQKRVKLTDVTAVTLDAIVSDQQDYSVSVDLMHDCDLEYRCNCPAGSKEIFCVHCVAAAVCWLSGNYDDEIGCPAVPADLDPAAAGLQFPEMRQRLESMDKSALVELILNWADRDPGLAAHLAGLSALEPDAEALLAAVRLKEEIAGNEDWEDL